jgi:hypothetical protein
VCRAQDHHGPLKITVSGQLVELNRLDRPKGKKRGVGVGHWLGWVDGRYVVAAWGRDDEDIPPLKGVISPSRRKVR